MPSLRPRLALVLALGVALAVSLGLSFHWSRQLAVCRRQAEANLHSLQLLQQALRERDLQKPPVVSEGEAPLGNDRAALAKRDANITLLNRELSEARANIMQLQTQLSNANDDRQKALADADERSQKQQEDWQGRLDALQKELNSAQDEAETARQRATALEADNSKLHSDLSDNTARAAELNHAASDLQNLNRRRDVYLTSIVRQYREITSQFRAMSGMLDSSRDQSSSAFSGAALTRIQNAISQADDDLRQLNDLNAQAHQLEKKFMKK